LVLTNVLIFFTLSSLDIISSFATTNCFCNSNTNCKFALFTGLKNSALANAILSILSFPAWLFLLSFSF
jgi:hypothetical protein